jgi:hypothetical protein
MQALEYADLELKIQSTEGSEYSVLAKSEEAKTDATTTFMLPFSQRELSLIMTTLRSAAQNYHVLRSIVSPTGEEPLLEEVGKSLFDCLFRGPTLEYYNGMLNLVRRESRGLRIRLNIEPMELMPLPWEFLYSPLDGFCSLTRDVSLVRTADKLPRPYEIHPPLRMVILSSNPEGSATLSLQRESRVIKDATEPLVKSKQISIEHIEAASLNDIRRRLMSLSDEPPHILHYMGHGDLDRLLLEDEVGAAKPLSGGSLAIILRMIPSIKLVVLNACETGQADVSNMRLGVANALARSGMPAVIAMQFRISDDAALAFSKGLYEALVAGHPIDTAMVWARVTIHTEFSGNTAEWGTPVLYMLGKEPLFFQVMAQEKVQGEEASIHTIGYTGSVDKADINFLIHRLGHENEEESQSAEMALITLGKPVIIPLIDSLPTMDEKVLPHAMAVLMQIGKPIVSPLLAALPKMSGQVLLGAAGVLQEIGLDENAEPAIENWINMMHELDQEAIAHNGVVLAMFGEPAVRPLIKALADKNAKIRLLATMALQFREELKRKAHS